jgi:hypothetical protein
VGLAQHAATSGCTAHILITQLAIRRPGGYYPIRANQIQDSNLPSYNKIDILNACAVTSVFKATGDPNPVSYFICGHDFNIHDYYRTPPAAANSEKNGILLEFTVTDTYPVVVTTPNTVYYGSTSSTGSSSRFSISTTPTSTSAGQATSSPPGGSSSSTSQTSSPSVAHSSLGSVSSSASTASSGLSNQVTETPSVIADSGLSPSNKIALGVGLGVGLPTVLISILAWWYPRRRHLTIEQPAPQVSEIPKPPGEAVRTSAEAVTHGPDTP